MNPFSKKKQTILKYDCSCVDRGYLFTTIQNYSGNQVIDNYNLNSGQAIDILHQNESNKPKEISTTSTCKCIFTQIFQIELNNFDFGSEQQLL